MVGPHLGTAPGAAGLAASLQASCPKIWGYGGGWAGFSDSRRGLTVYAGAGRPSLLEGLNGGTNWTKTEKAKKGSREGRSR
jgi:hypothetical protein